MFGYTYDSRLSNHDYGRKANTSTSSIPTVIVVSIYVMHYGDAIIYTISVAIVAHGRAGFLVYLSPY